MSRQAFSRISPNLRGKGGMGFNNRPTAGGMGMGMGMGRSAGGAAGGSMRSRNEQHSMGGQGLEGPEPTKESKCAYHAIQSNFFFFF